MLKFNILIAKDDVPGLDGFVMSKPNKTERCPFIVVFSEA